MFTLNLELYKHLDSIMDVFQVFFQDGLGGKLFCGTPTMDYFRNYTHTNVSMSGLQ